MSRIDDDVEMGLVHVRFLLNIILNNEDWDELAEMKLSKLTKIVALLSKLSPMTEKIEREIDPEKDDEIIKRFLERNS